MRNAVINQRAGIHGPLMNHELLPMVNKKRKFSHLTSVITMQKLFSSVPQKCLQNLQYFIPPHKILNTDKKLQSHCCLTKVHFNVSEISKAEYPWCRRQTAATSQFLAMVPSKFSHYFFSHWLKPVPHFRFPGTEHGCGRNPDFKKGLFTFSSAKSLHSTIFSVQWQQPPVNRYILLPSMVSNT